MTDSVVSSSEIARQAAVVIQRLERRVVALETARSEPIAVIGIGCRLPGGVSDAVSLWNALENGVDAIRRVPADRWAIEDDPGADPIRRAVRWGGFIDDVRGFDASFFGISPREALFLDPQQRLLLEVTWEALEDAGIPPDRLHESRTGVYIGFTSNDYTELCGSLPREQQDMYVATGNGHCFPPGRLAYTLGLQGPALAVDTACSSSLVAVHLACQALRTGDCTLAVVGGVNLMLSQSTTDLIANLQALSPDGRCKTFDAAANGFVRGEGAASVVLKRQSDALRDGDPILALIRGSAVNQDGRAAGLTVPNAPAQKAMLRAALQSAGVAAHEIDYVECHGTGTPLGDPLELEALDEVLREGRAPDAKCALGAVKTNFGHLEAAAGIAGLIKTVLALKHRAIPRNLNFKAPNPRLRLADTPFTLPTETLPWPARKKRRLAGVSSFGLSGTNAHVVLEEAPVVSAVSAPERGAELFVVSARTADSLAEQAARLATHVGANPELTLGDLAFSLATTRTEMECRLAVVADSHAELRAGLSAAAERRDAAGVVQARAAAGGAPKVVFVFPGHGSQWLGMGRQLLRDEPVFREAIEACDGAIQAEAGWSLLAELSADEAASRLDRTEVVQPALFSIAVALASLWRSLGVEPDAVVGHSMGEIAAAHVAGALSLEDAVAVVCRRSEILRRIFGHGEMALIELPLADATAALKGYESRLSVAVNNSPRTSVIAGDPTAMAEVLAALEAKGVFCRRVKVDYASHSPQVEPLCDDIARALATLAPKPCRVRMRSTVTGTNLQGAELAGRYWADNLRQPVRFCEVVQSLIADGHGLFVEMSPHPLLLPAVDEILRDASAPGVAVGSLRRNQSERVVLLESLGSLWVHGHAARWDRVFPAQGKRVRLPTYAWQREPYWVEPQANDSPRMRSRANRGHPLMGESLSVSTQSGMQIWEGTIELARLTWLGDHRVQGNVILPGAAYLEMALSAAAETFGGAQDLELSEVEFSAALVLSGDVSLQLVLTEEGAGRRRFQIASRAASATDTPWHVQSRGWLRQNRADATRIELAGLRDSLGEEVDVGARYTALAEFGLEFGPAFQGLQELRHGEREALGRVRLPEAAASPARYAVHPAMLDACMQSMIGILADATDDSPWVPVRVRSFQLVRRPASELWCHAKVVAAEDPARRSADVTLIDGEGDVVAVIRGIEVQRMVPANRATQDDGVLEVAWEACEFPAPKLSAGRWLLLGSGQDLANSLQTELERAGHVVTRISVDQTSASDLAMSLAQAFGGLPPTAIVHLASMDVPKSFDPAVLERALELGCGSVLSVVQALAKMEYREAPRLWLVTRGAQAVEPQEVSVFQAPLLGLGRVIALEHPEFRSALLDLDPRRSDGEVSAVTAELLADDLEEEVAHRGGERYVSRLTSRPRDATRREHEEPAEGRPYRLEIDTPGVLDGLVLRERAPRPPRAGEIQIAVEAAGLNFLDVMKAMGVYPGLDGPPELGAECAGRVSAVGPGVTGFHVGQSVMAIASATFSTHVTVDARFARERPANLPPSQAASVLTVFATAWYALVHVARLRAGERVLIHSATGGTGLAALQIARALGAEVFATAGNDAKRAWLREQGIEHVMDSRSLEFAKQVLDWTHGEGVDVVLNSLSGAAIEASLSALAPDGRFLEIGKTDIYSERPINLAPFKKGLSYSAIDLAGLALRRPDRFATVVSEVVDRFARGELQPVPIEEFPASRAVDAFRKMAQAQHIGKLVLRLDDAQTPIRVSSAPSIRSDGTYLVTGGLGGLGLSVARWLAEKGAGHLVLVGRSGASTEAQRAAVAAIEALGGRVTVARLDVSDRASLQRLLSEVSTAKQPLRGVIHSAAVLDDGVVLQQTPERLRTAMGAKALGALHLHTLTRDAPLDFFVMYASAAGLLGSPGQANYAAANAFLDALAHHRKTQGWPALSIDWGAFSEVGLAIAHENRGERLASRGLRSLTPEEGLAALEWLLGETDAQVGVLPLDVRQLVEFYPTAASSRRLSRLLANRASAARSAADRELLDRLATAEPAERETLVRAFLRAQVSLVLRIPEKKLDDEAMLKNLGMDSLMGLELRNRIEGGLGIVAPAALGWTYPTIAALARWLIDDALADQFESGPRADRAARSNTRTFVRALCFRPIDTPRFRLFCFHGSAGSPEHFRPWIEPASAQDIELSAIWHDRRLGAEPDSGVRYVREAAELVRHKVDVPYAFVGISLGVRLAMGTARYLHSLDVPVPARMFLFGAGLSGPTPRDTSREHWDGMIDRLFPNVQSGERTIEQIRADSDVDFDIAGKMADMPPMFMNAQELRAGAAATPAWTLPIPIVSVSGLDDELGPIEFIETLRQRTSASFSISFFPGGHELLVHRMPELLELIQTELDPLVPGRSGGKT